MTTSQRVGATTETDELPQRQQQTEVAPLQQDALAPRAIQQYLARVSPAERNTQSRDEPTQLDLSTPIYGIEINSNPNVIASRDSLVDTARRSMSAVAFRRFEENIKTFEQRAANDKLAPGQVAQTYEQIARLFERNSSAPVSQSRRSQLAQQVLRQAADPSSIDQGEDYNTCTVTTIENRIYSREPAVAAKLVADVGTTGRYTAADGTTVQLDWRSLKPHGSARTNPAPDEQRSFATQLFNVTAVNLHYAATNPNLRYEQRAAANADDSGERIMDYSKRPPQALRNDKGKIIAEPNLDDDHVVQIHNRIVGRNDTDFYFSHSKYLEGEANLLTHFSTEQEMVEKLQRAKEQGKLPVLLSVNCAVEPFWTTSGKGDINPSYEGEHVVIVRDVDPGPPPRVSIDNQYGRRGDHLGAKSLDVRTLYRATLPTAEAVNSLAQEIDAERAAGRLDPAKERELKRLRGFLPK